MATYIENEEETEPIEEIEQPDETEEDTEGEIYLVEVEVENGKVIYDEPFDFENRTITWSETTIYAKWIKEYSICCIFSCQCSRTLSALT